MSNHTTLKLLALTFLAVGGLLAGLLALFPPAAAPAPAGATILCGAALATLLQGLLLRRYVSRAVTEPLRALGSEANRLAEGDLSFALAAERDDDIGQLQSALKESLRSVSGILRRVGEVARRVAEAAERVEKESRQVVVFTGMEARAIDAVSTAVTELNGSIREIAVNIEGLAAAVEQSSAAMVEMTASIAGVGAMVHELSDGVNATGSSIEELSATLGEVADGAGELAGVADSTLSAVEQIIGSIAEIEQKVKESAELSQRVSSAAATTGATAMTRSSQGMERIRVAVEKTATALRQLDGRSAEIGKILTVIGEITDQTTLLALNAAILAAQSGEQGRSFAVVASEMKDLSERTAGSTREIGTLIEAVQRELRSAVGSMDEALHVVDAGATLNREAADAFATILSSAQESSAMTLSIVRTTGEQSRAAQLVSASVEQVRRMVQRMARATAEQSRGIALIMQATTRIGDASERVRVSADEQLETSRMIARAVNEISGSSRRIADAINEQQEEVARIDDEVGKIREIPRQSKDISFRVNRTLREVSKDVELITFEMASFKLHAEESGVLRFGIVPVESPVDMFRRYTPLARYLAARLGRKVELRIAPNFDTALRELGSGATALCSMPSMIYIEAQRAFGAETLAAVKRNGKSWHHSVIVVREDAPFRALADLKGGTMAFVDEKAAAGYVMPRAMLEAAGVPLHELSYHNFTGAHDEVARAVLRGEFDAGGLMESTARKYRDQGLKILATSEPVPEWNICCHGLEPPLKHALQQALLDLDGKTPAGAEVLRAIESGCSGFARSADSDHDGMRAMLARIGLL